MCVRLFFKTDLLGTIYYRLISYLYKNSMLTFNFCGKATLYAKHNIYLKKISFQIKF